MANPSFSKHGNTKVVNCLLRQAVAPNRFLPGVSQFVDGLTGKAYWTTDSATYGWREYGKYENPNTK